MYAALVLKSDLNLEIKFDLSFNCASLPITQCLGTLTCGLERVCGSVTFLFVITADQQYCLPPRPKNTEDSMLLAIGRELKLPNAKIFRLPESPCFEAAPLQLILSFRPVLEVGIKREPTKIGELIRIPFLNLILAIHEVVERPVNNWLNNITFV